MKIYNHQLRNQNGTSGISLLSLNLNSIEKYVIKPMIEFFTLSRQQISWKMLWLINKLW